MLLGEPDPGSCLHFQSDMQRFVATPGLHVPTLSPLLLANVLQPLMVYGAVAVRLRRFLDLVEEGRNTVRVDCVYVCFCVVYCLCEMWCLGCECIPIVNVFLCVCSATKPCVHQHPHILTTAQALVYINNYITITPTLSAFTACLQRQVSALQGRMLSLLASHRQQHTLLGLYIRLEHELKQMAVLYHVLEASLPNGMGSDRNRFDLFTCQNSSAWTWDSECGCC